MNKAIQDNAVKDRERLRQELIAAYEGLESRERAALRLLSIYFEPVNRTVFLNCLRKAGVRAANGKAFSNQSVTPLLDGLISRGLVERHDNQFRCHQLLLEHVTRDTLRDGDFQAMVTAVHDAIKAYGYGWGSYQYFRSYGELLRELRIAFYQQDIPRADALLERAAKDFPDQFAGQHPYVLICNNPFDATWLRTLPDPMVGDVLTMILNQGVCDFDPLDEVSALAETLYADEDGFGVLGHPLAERWLSRGELARVEAMVQGHELVGALALRGWMSFLAGDNEAAIGHYQTALRELRKATRKRKIFFANLAGVFFLLALLRSGETAYLREAAEYLAILAKTDQRRYAPTYEYLREVAELQLGQHKPSVPGLAEWIVPGQPVSVNGFFYLLSRYWLGAGDAAALRKPVQALFAAAEQSGYGWFAAELAELLCRLGAGEYKPQAEHWRRQSGGGRSIVELFERKEPWEHVLNALIELDQSAGEDKPAAQSRLVWLLKCYKNGHCTIVPREQKRTSRGNWTKGRPIALKRLYGGAAKLDFLTPQDVKVCAAIRQTYETSYGYYGSTIYEIDYRQGLPALVGHPLVFWEDAPEVRVELIEGEPELLVTENRGKLRIELSPKLTPGETLLAVKETPTRLKVIEISKEHQGIHAILGEGLRVPLAAKDKVLAAIAALSRRVTVQSSVGGGVEDVEEIAADPIPHVHLLPMGEGLKLAVLTQPFRTGGPYYRPGAGGERVIAEVDGKRLQARRDLAQERERANEIVAAVPTLARLAPVDGEYGLEDPEECLETLLALQALGDKAVLEWPEGEKLRISHRASLEQFRLTIRRQKDWFSVTGELRLDDQQVLDMARLLELASQGSGRFVPLGDGQFLALTREFRKRLDDLASFTEPTAKGVRCHPLVVPVLEELTTEAGTVRADAHWKAQIRRLREAEALQPAVPSTLHAELRDYQVAGFQWLARLAYWGVGACLADDMGLGKTVQALALMLVGAQDGPTLVVAPTSVCANWQDEAQRFAPTLNVVGFGGADRQKTLEQLGPFDVLVCSYGLLQQEAERLAERYWQTIVLDEAQAIKNAATKRSQAAMGLQGGFKMMTTGTPIENHLGELWNLFRFINPGLLGSLESFNRRFAVPIERDRDAQARNKLKRLIQPFILRRTKVEVLEELPPRTEILLHVERTQEEAALYEALRRQALERLAKTEGSTGQKQLQILAEIMKLRRACCNPRLVVPDTSVPSAKLAVFEEVLDDLLENRHKALVFSQFVGHLEIIREVLDRRGVAYQYLDGSTPAAERKQRVDAFQAGQGQVFLISLKAGGLGLNLTAADYVIHMDPWWNPAVEDQAADRAHRIGQQRPVTIYRLVVKDTIEDKIVELHHQKRDLAESLLEGTGGGGKISAEELLRLLEET